MQNKVSHPCRTASAVAANVVPLSQCGLVPHVNCNGRSFKRPVWISQDTQRRAREFMATLLLLLFGCIVLVPFAAVPHRMATTLLVLLGSPAAQASPPSVPPVCPSHCGQSASASCHAACNTLACGHHGCSFAEAARQCLSDTERSMRVAPAAANVSVRLSMFDGLSIEADPKTELPYARLPLKFIVEWTSMVRVAPPLAVPEDVPCSSGLLEAQPLPRLGC